jgi:NADH dehydrogenase
MGVVAVVGGTGFLGRHVLPALGEAGWEARPLSRRTGFSGLAPDVGALRGASAVVNLAGIKREAGPQTFRAIHVELVAKLVEAMKAAGVRRLIHVSVVASRPSDSQPYLDSKWQGEEGVRRSGLDWTLLRPGVIYGEGDDLLSHLSFMIRASPVFPIVGHGQATVMPVDAKDVARAVVRALERPESVGRSYDLVGPDRLTLRETVQRVARAEALPLALWPTPAWLLFAPVWAMEAFARHPLSTRAQLSMLREGLFGDPEPARRDLGLDPEPFTPERLRPLLGKGVRRPPLDLRIFSAPRTSPEIPWPGALALGALAAAALTGLFLGPGDRWTGMTLAMGSAGALALLFRAVRRRIRPTWGRIAIGLFAGGALFGLSALGARLLGGLWPGWVLHARVLYRWRGDHALLFLSLTLPLIVLSEELVWRGVVARALAERWGRGPGILAGAAVYAAAHLATGNPVLLAAALSFGIFWGWLSLATDDLTAPFFCHFTWDLLVLFLFPLAS